MGILFSNALIAQLLFVEEIYEINVYLRFELLVGVHTLEAKGSSLKHTTSYQHIQHVSTYLVYQQIFGPNMRGGVGYKQKIKMRITNTPSIPERTSQVDPAHLLWRVKNNSDFP